MREIKNWGHFRQSKYFTYVRVDMSTYTIKNGPTYNESATQPPLTGKNHLNNINLKSLDTRSQKKKIDHQNIKNRKIHIPFV